MIKILLLLVSFSSYAQTDSNKVATVVLKVEKKQKFFRTSIDEHNRIFPNWFNEVVGDNNPIREELFDLYEDLSHISINGAQRILTYRKAYQDLWSDYFDISVQLLTDISQDEPNKLLREETNKLLKEEHCRFEESIKNSVVDKINVELKKSGDCFRVNGGRGFSSLSSEINWVLDILETERLIKRRQKR